MAASLFKQFTNCALCNHKIGFLVFRLKQSSCSKTTMKVLNVAEKNDVAKNVSAFLSNGHVTRRESLSKFNKIYEFDCEVFGRNSRMVMTSVTGHLMQYNFIGEYRKWPKVDPISLFEAPIEKVCIDGSENIKKTLEREIKFCNSLIIWTDCDREGESIGFEIIEVCKAVKPNIRVYRAKFSEITHESVKRALRSLETPNKFVNEAVNVRRVLDLRIGAAFTRFQTCQLQRNFPDAFQRNLISYGSCQFPTLGFVVDRFKAISEFIQEKFWQIDVKHIINGMTVDFKWKRDRLFNEIACKVLYDKCIECNIAMVEEITSKSKTKYRPKPLDTVELEKVVSKKCGITAKETMRIAEKLYTLGLISYPRTETNIFFDLDLKSLVQHQTEDQYWGEFAQRVLSDGPNPFQGTKTDNAHPPIHPIKYSKTLIGNEKIIYEFIVRRFLACLSKHAEGLETIVNIDIAGEKFEAKGLMITAKNYLEVYPYDRWNDKEIHVYRKGDTFKPEIVMSEGKTTPPELLTEADLIGLMEKHGIGTDATHAEHIENIKARLYVGLKDNKYFVPRTLGMGLVESYNCMGYAMAKPELRAELERDLKRICDNQKSPGEVLSRHLTNYKGVYENVQRQANILTETIQSYIQIEPVQHSGMSENNFEVVAKCPRCDSNLVLKEKDSVRFIGCSNYPHCQHKLWFPSMVKNVAVTNDTCHSCGPNTYLLKFKFEQGSSFLPTPYVGCIWCDENLSEILNSGEGTRNSHILSSSASESIDSTGLSRNNGNGNTDNGFNTYNETPSSSGTSSTPNMLAASGLPQCHCGLPAVRLLVKKCGPNFGRTFYKCSATGHTLKCSFFLWEGDEKNTTETPRSTRDENSSLENYTVEEPLHCYCGLPSKRRLVAKDGPNKGREFNACIKGKDGCNFFKWTESNQDDMKKLKTNFVQTNPVQRETFSRSVCEVAKRMPVKQTNGTSSRKINCGICGQEGHNKKKCPKK